MSERDVHDRNVPPSWVSKNIKWGNEAARSGNRPCKDPDCFSSAPPQPDKFIPTSDFCPVHQPDVV